MVKKIAIYGAHETWVPVIQRYWKRRKDGWKQRYWIKTKRMKSVVSTSGRFEFHGKGKDLYKAVMKATHYTPKGFVDVSAEEFVEHPEDYGFKGKWVDWEVVS